MNAYLFVPDVNDFGLAPAIACGVHVKDLKRRTENEREVKVKQGMVSF